MCTQTNEDHCSACRSLGALVYCDGCPRAFHWICLDPPMEATDLPEGESRWFCPACTLEKVRVPCSQPVSLPIGVPGGQKPTPKIPASLKFMAPLVNELATRIPAEYQLPQDIRSFFKDGMYRTFSPGGTPVLTKCSWHRSERRVSRHIGGQATPVQVSHPPQAHLSRLMSCSQPIWSTGGS